MPFLKKWKFHFLESENICDFFGIRNFKVHLITYCILSNVTTLIRDEEKYSHIKVIFHYYVRAKP